MSYLADKTLICDNCGKPADGYVPWWEMRQIGEGDSTREWQDPRTRDWEVFHDTWLQGVRLPGTGEYGADGMFHTCPLTDCRVAAARVWLGVPLVLAFRHLRKRHRESDGESYHGRHGRLP